MEYNVLIFELISEFVEKSKSSQGRSAGKLSVEPLWVLGYNQLVDHVGIHGQRRLTEALNKDSLVRRKEYPTESSSKSRDNNPLNQKEF
ncbi:hypothetical protein Taro_002277 [Colocasia esculenta]|uniref:Uncharacterized protein n=1 Tax=Colocasia esculenta TaxID=4460 RepID=A0A843TGT5_COLES|nr:hypothetical protein [Colocasia esculenta]